MAGGGPAGLGIADDDVAAAADVVIPPDVTTRQLLARGCPGSKSRTLAVAATSTLTATPDPLVSESMPRPLPRPARAGAGTSRSSGPAGRQQLSRGFFRFHVVRCGRGCGWGHSAGSSADGAPFRPVLALLVALATAPWPGPRGSRRGRPRRPHPRARSPGAARRRVRPSLRALSGAKIRARQKEWGRPPGRYSQIPQGGSPYTPTRFIGRSHITPGLNVLAAQSLPADIASFPACDWNSLAFTLLP